MVGWVGHEAMRERINAYEHASGYATMQPDDMIKSQISINSMAFSKKTWLSA